MQFLVIAKDKPDILQKRLEVRDQHIAYTDQHADNMIMGVATLDDNRQMNGSTLIVDFPTRADLDAWLQSEPYLQNGVWDDVSITPCKVGPSFIKS